VREHRQKLQIYDVRGFGYQSAGYARENVAANKFDQHKKLPPIKNIYKKRKKT